MKPFLLRLLACLSVVSAVSANDPYETYIRTSEDFRSVKQDEAWALNAFPSWTYIPWTYRWTIGYSDESGQWSLNHGYNGAFIDRGNIATEDSKTGKLDWIEKFDLRFYMDHTAGKGDLHLWDGDKVKPYLDQVHGTGIRTVPLNDKTKDRLKDTMRRNIENVKDSPQRAAYALDDEPSWGHFVHPTMWRVTDNESAFPGWLEEVYGEGNAPHREEWISYEDIRPKLANWSIAEFDASPLMDQWSFNDSHWCNYIGDLVEFSNTLDPATPCGLVGGQQPSAFGGYDYAKLMRKVQFIESYNLGSSQAVIRSFNPRNALPSVTTHFHKSAADTIWQTWYYLAHGNRGHIGWVDKWFEGETPMPWHAEVAPAFLEAGQKIGPMMKGAQWQHDGIAIYYNHASIQLGWILDAEAHGKTWVNRNGDHRLASAALVRKAWENMLRDSGLQYDFINYVDVIQNGIPDEYRVLVLPACLCLSDAEARAIRRFCKRGGTVIADYLPGLWDQHGKGRSGGGALDDIFGVTHDPSMKAADVFGESLWVEVDQDKNYSYRSFEEFLSNENTCLKESNGFHKAVRAITIEHTSQYKSGKAHLLNLSPQWYNFFRAEGFESATRRSVFIDPIFEAGVAPRVRIQNASEDSHGVEITIWKLESGRTMLFVCLNPEIQGSSQGGGNSVGLETNVVRIELEFASPIRKARDERTERELGDGLAFSFDWKKNEAIVLTYNES